MIKILDHMVDILLVNNIKKVTFMSFLLLSLCYNKSFSQNYPVIDSVYQTPYKAIYREHLPIKHCVFKINHEQLLEELKNHDKALVYLFVNGCKSEYCLPMYMYENWAKENGYKLFLVMYNVSNFRETLSQNPSEQIYVADYDYYKKRIPSKQFKNGLKGLPVKQRYKFEGSLFVFKNGVYQATYRELHEIKEL